MNLGYPAIWIISRCRRLLEMRQLIAALKIKTRIRKIPGKKSGPEDEAGIPGKEDKGSQNRETISGNDQEKILPM
ncbi:MAG TPA: hypothetical protein DCP02_01360 [Actinobacteria bacterium]|nr:hypothetical protein [Actinomycetota bacterium]